MSNNKEDKNNCKAFLLKTIWYEMVFVLKLLLLLSSCRHSTAVSSGANLIKYITPQDKFNKFFPAFKDIPKNCSLKLKLLILELICSVPRCNKFYMIVPCSDDWQLSYCKCLWNSEVGELLSGILDVTLNIFTDNWFLVMTGNIVPFDTILKKKTRKVKTS